MPRKVVVILLRNPGKGWKKPRLYSNMSKAYKQLSKFPSLEYMGKERVNSYSQFTVMMRTYSDGVYFNFTDGGNQYEARVYKEDVE